MLIGLYSLLFFIATSFASDKRNNNEILKKDENLSKLEHPKINVNATLLEIFQAAMQSYLNEDWSACIEGFRQLEYMYKTYKNAIVDCRRKCRINLAKFEPIYSENIEDIQFYERKIKETLCIVSCNQEYRKRVGKNALRRLPQKVELKLMFGEYYEYLHICYFQKNYYQKAANAVFTFLIYHPNHKPSKLSLSYYMNFPQVKSDSIHSLLEEPFINDYKKGIKAYNAEYYDEAVKKIETSVMSYIESEEKCRFYCEGPIEHDWNPEFITSISNHFVYNLHCKRRCARYLQTVNGEYRHDFVANYFNYLQFAYYKLNDIKKACEAVATYLLFYPSDETMLSNKYYYASLLMVKESYFMPRKEIAVYVTRQEYEIRLLLFINKEFIALENEFISSELDNPSNIKEI